MADYRVLVTGSRTWTDWQRIWGALKAIADQVGPDRLVIVHGACGKGADLHAENYGCTYGIRTEPHPAAWRVDGKFNGAAGFERNAEMVASRPDMCLAYISPCEDRRCRKPRPHGSHGATHCADLAENAGIDTRRTFGD